MKRFLFVILLILLLFNSGTAHAEIIKTGRAIADVGLRIRATPSTSGTQLGTIPYGTIVRIIGEANGSGCNDPWFQVIYSTGNSNINGYSCSTYITEITEYDTEENTPTTPPVNSEDFEAYLTSQGFPESYKVKLRILHEQHPNWIFVGIKVRESWQTSLNLQGEDGRSTLNVNAARKALGQEGYLSTAAGHYNYETDTFIPKDGTYWFQANSDAIGYYLDPRNFMDEKNVFMFESLLQNDAIHTKSVVDGILSSDFMKQYSNHFMKGARDYNVSATHLASLSRQEVGITNGNIVTNGKAGVLSDGVNYNGYYNFFNIGASSSGDPKLKSLQSAKARGWNSPEKSIVGGAAFISSGYINAGQYTAYLQKFNVDPNATKGIWHQYMTNIAALSSPAITTYNSYNNLGFINHSFIFSIPIFTNMPESTSLPPLGNPNNWLKEIKINGIALSSFYGGTTNYTIDIPYEEEITVEAKKVNSNATVSGTGTKALTEDKTTLTIKVTAQNGSVKNYTVTVNRGIKDDPNLEIDLLLKDVLTDSKYKYDSKNLWGITLGTSVKSLTSKIKGKYKTVSVNIKNKDGNTKTDGVIVTGDKVTITTKQESTTIEVIIFGDTNGDGYISAIDILSAQKHILGYTTLLGTSFKAADINKDGVISAYDLLQFQKHVLGYTNISQS